MKRLREEELKSIKGGASVSTVFLISSVVAVVIGIIDGICRPLPCNK